MILLPWSETGTVSEIPSSFDHAPLGANADPLANKDFEKLVNNVFDGARQTCGVGVYIDKSLLRTGTVGEVMASSPVMERPTRQLSRTWTGVSMPDIHHNGGMLFRSSDSHGRSEIRVLYTGNPDDMFAVRLALQLAKNGGVHVKIINVVEEQSGTSRRSFGLGKKQDTPLKDVVAEANDLVKPLVTLEDITRSSTEDAEMLDKIILNAPSETGEVTILVGRGVHSSAPSSLSSSAILEKHGVLGSTAASLVARMKETKVAVNVLVVQGRTSSKAAEQRKGKGAGVSQESLSDS